MGVWWSVLWCQQALHEVKKVLDHGALRNGGDLLEAVFELLQAGRQVFVKQDGEVSLLRLDLPCLYPAGHHSE